MCTPRHIFFGQPYQRGWNGRSMWYAWERFLLYRVLFRNPEGKRPRGTTGRVELQGGSENAMLSTGFIWLRTRLLWTRQWNSSSIKFREFIENLMFIGPCIIVIVEEWKTNLMSLVILFHFLCVQHVSDINIAIIKSLRLCCWMGGVHFARRSLKNEHHPKQAAPKLQHTTNWEQDDRCGNSATQSQASDDGYINVRNMLNT